MPEPRDLAGLFVETTSAAATDGVSGMLVVIDEMGKVLEYAAQHPDQSDLFVLQWLAEVAARSNHAPLLVLAVLHQGAEAYAHRLPRDDQAEWAKVVERYRQLHFDPSLGERMDMVGRAIKHSRELDLGTRLDGVLHAWSSLDIEHSGLRERFPSLARAAYPLHPLTLLALPSLYRRAGQSHRSVFGFLGSEDAHGFGRYLRDTAYDPQSPPLLTLDMLYDHVAAILFDGWVPPALSHAWSQATDVVDRADGVSDVARRVLRCLALLGILRDSRLPPTPELLRLALADACHSSADIGAALQELQDRRLIAHSRFRGTYRVCEGGDIDIDAELLLARSSLPPSVVMRVARLLCPPPQLCARRHSYETGTLRVVGTRVCEADDLATTIDSAAADLTVVLCLVGSRSAHADAAAVAELCAKPNALVGIAIETEILRESARDVAAAHELPDRLPDLQTDRAARLELSARWHDAEAAFRAEWARLFGATEQNASWFWLGERPRITSSRSFSEVLSLMADRTYADTPVLHNELVNRHALSSSAAAGRRSLIEAMLTKRDHARLAITAYPPQASMYECVLRVSGLHRRDSSGGWAFGAPSPDDPARLRPTWDTLRRMVLGEAIVARPVTEVIATLAAPPLGVTEGVAPILLCAFLLAHERETTLYRDGTFLPEPTVADWEVLLRRPELFAVAGCSVTGDRRAIVDRLAAGLGTQADVLPVVRALYRYRKQLPDHALRTMEVPEAAVRFREAMDRARAPEALLFADIPTALGVALPGTGDPDPETIEGFFGALNDVLRALGQALPTATGQALAVLLGACGLPPGHEGLRLLREYAGRMEPIVTNAVLVPFVRRAAEPADDTTLVDKVLAYVADKPPRTWSDADVTRCHSRARAIGELFSQAASQALCGTVEPALDVDESEVMKAVALVNAALCGMPAGLRRAALARALQTCEPAVRADASDQAGGDPNVGTD